ncbi:MAG: exo-alpha-sialidase [Kiritimatiellae bacterium]|nr:exo-alpha-sialidase [Kiritimatiellia bacterium]
MKLQAQGLIFPPAKKQCHASTLVQLPDGELLAAWFMGTQERHPDVGIWLSRGRNDRWGTPVEVAKIRYAAHWNPVLFQPGPDRVLLFFKVGVTIPRWVTYVCESRDGGATWTQPRTLVPGDRSGGRGPVKNKPIRLACGAILAPMSIETLTRWTPGVDRSEDEGARWERTMVPMNRKQVAGRGLIQPTLWESKPGRVHMLLRSTAHRIYRADSTDDGRTWCEAYPTEFPHNNSGLDLARHLKKPLLTLVCNPVEKGRSPLVVIFSTDNGRSWQDEIVLEDTKGEFSYPAIIPIADGFAVTYTWERRSIGFATIACFG